jgi:hypothetical protein
MLWVCRQQDAVGEIEQLTLLLASVGVRSHLIGATQPTFTTCPVWTHGRCYAMQSACNQML